ncbi:N-acetyltransferase [Roseobacter sp. HKCCA0434]|uniref:GNAT family N-acetyltransferase n=1 Tax=Roseobacter sp. HKCCA0434 TaxID=3079297 RepID=UPI0029059784|nr:N-acetyltransferase [Roseobacter sp. HKCCA0434]
MRLLPETPESTHEVEYLYDTAFAPGRTALSSYRLRAGPPVEGLSWTVRDDYDTLAAAIRYWPVLAGDAPALLLGPIAVHPTRQGEGLGGLLMRHTLDLAPSLGWKRVILVGDPPYYTRFGFRRDLAERLEYPPPTNPDRLLARELVEGAMQGVAGMVVPLV